MVFVLLFCGGVVAPLAEGVDRNMVFVLLFCGGVVALLAEGVDRNWFERA